MKFQTQYDQLDPEVSPGNADLDSEASADPNAPDDAYVIGEDGGTVKVPDGTARRKGGERSKPWVRPLAYGLAAVFVGLTLWNVSRVMGGPRPLPPPTQFQVKQTLYMGVLRVDAFRRIHGVTPESLSEAGLPESSGYTYQRLDSAHYILGFQNGGPKLEYNSNDPKESFFGSPEAMLTMGGSR